jgi:hypothetical protein
MINPTLDDQSLLKGVVRCPFFIPCIHFSLNKWKKYGSWLLTNFVLDFYITYYSYRFSMN